MSIDSHQYTPIKEITTWTPRWTLLARVTNKSPVTTFKRQDGGSGKVLSLDIMDHEGTSIRAKFWGDAVDKWENVLQEAKIYTFSGGRVQLANKKFNNLNHAYELTFDVDSKINEAPASQDGITPHSKIPYIRKYNFTTLRDIHHSPRELPFLVDLITVLKWISPSIEQFVNRTTQDVGIRRLAHVVDDTGYQMTLTLFGSCTEYRHPENNEDLLKPGVILAIQNVQIREFRGRNGSTVRASHLSVSPHVPEAQRLQAWLATVDFEKESFKMLSEVSSRDLTSLTKELSKKSDSPTLLEHVVVAMEKMDTSYGSTSADSAKEVFVVSPVEITKLLYINRASEVTLIYPSCPSCNRKVTPSVATCGFRCEACLLDLEQPTYRFMFAVHLVDSSGGRFLARVFHDVALVILKMSAERMAQLVPPRLNSAEIPMEARTLLEYDVLWQKYSVALRCRREYFGGEERTNVSIASIEPYDYTLDAKNLLKTIHQFLDVTLQKKRPGRLSTDNFSQQEIKKFKE